MDKTGSLFPQKTIFDQVTDNGLSWKVSATMSLFAFSFLELLQRHSLGNLYGYDVYAIFAFLIL